METDRTYGDRDIHERGEGNPSRLAVGTRGDLFASKLDSVQFASGCDEETPARTDGWAVAITHELAQPIAAIAMHGQACLRWLDSGDVQREEVRASINRVIRNASRAYEILSCIRALSGNEELELEVLDIHELIEFAVTELQPELIRKDVRTRIDLHSRAFEVQGNRTLLNQVIRNVLRNGLEAIVAAQTETRELSVRSKAEAGNIRVTVEDSGIGLESGDFERPFKSFFSTKPHGMGVGLPLCRAIIERHGGSISATPKSGPGAAFFFMLPTVQIFR